jgi:hypothetical protein
VHRDACASRRVWPSTGRKVIGRERLGGREHSSKSRPCSA